MNVQRLERLLKLRRSHGTLGEGIACDMIFSVANEVETFLDGKEHLAYAVTLPKADGTAYPVLWSCHVDTVHSMAGGTEQEITFDTHPDMMIAMSDGTQPLGADDGAGMWLLMEMIDAKVPGTYIFHRGEERGGIGSSGMAKLHDIWLKQFNHAIAFDRRGTSDVITHQARGRCCSDEFAKEFAKLLNIGHKPSNAGIFTDTANYIYDIPECTNVSCGYDSEHTAREILDLEHLFELRARLISAFCEAPVLTVERHVDDPDDSFSGWDYKYNYNYAPSSPKKDVPDDLYQMDEFDVADMKWHLLRKMVREDPDGAADLLIDLASKIIYNTEVQDDTDTDDYQRYNDHLKTGLY